MCVYVVFLNTVHEDLLYGYLSQFYQIFSLQFFANIGETSLPTEIPTLMSLMEEDGRFASISLEKAEEDSPMSHGAPTAGSLLLSMSCQEPHL